MELKLCLVNWFESDFQDRHYYIYQFVDPQTLTILNYSSDKALPYDIGSYLPCEVLIKKNRLYVASLKTSK